MHTEKQEIFDEYAKILGFSNWLHFVSSSLVDSEDLCIHTYNACDLVQKEQQKRIADNQRKIFYKFFEEGKSDNPEIIVQANSNENAYKEAYSHLGPMTEDLFYHQLTDEETLMLESNLIK